MQELDAITLKRAAKGDRHAFKSLYEHYAPFLWRVLYPLSGRDMMTARELLQDTFIHVNDTLKQFRGKSTLSTWLYRVAYTTAMQYLRKPEKRYRFHTYRDIQRGKERSDAFDNRQLVHTILGNLKLEDRFLLVAREVDGLSFDELAVITGNRPGALRTRLHRVKESVRAAFPNETYAMSEV